MRVAVFAKAPVAGQVKTRLAPLLGDAGAAALHRRLVHRAIETARDARVGEVELWCAPDASHSFFAECAETHGVSLRAQHGGDLGARMRHAFESNHGEGHALVVIGCDCLVLDGGAIRDAARALSSCDAAFAPAEDGGYVLVGLAKPEPAIFERIDWSTSRVMAQTRERLREAGLRWKELAMRWDLDRPEDYVRARREGLLEEARA